MLRGMKLFVLIIFSMALSSCAFAPVSKPDISKIESNIVKTRMYNPENKDLLTIAKESLEANGIEVLSFNRKLNFVRSKVTRVQVLNNCDCGIWNGAPVTGTVNATMQVTIFNVSDNRARVDLYSNFVAEFTGRNLYGAATRVETYQCASTGKIENDFWKIFDQLIAID